VTSSSGSSGSSARRLSSVGAAVGGSFVLALALAGWSAPAPADAAGPYYLSLGDSLAVGAQPDASGRDRATNQGYVDVVAARERASGLPGLRTVKLGCGGTTTRLIGGRPCNARYGQASQLEQAESFLAAHGSRTSLVTIDIGDNDVEGCISARGIDDACVQAGLTAVEQNLPVIARRLRAAAGPGVPIVGIADYDQFLALWLQGTRGRRIARASLGPVLALNRAMRDAYVHAGVAMADASAYFATRDFRHRLRVRGYGILPKAVARICQWTWACGAPSGGFDDHANARGYYVIAEAVLDTLAAQRIGGGPPAG
jgi:lysophospholipase L1-like esterase